MTSDGDKEYYYDVLGRLTLAESGLNSNVKLAGYRYDALGRLAMQVTYDYTHDPNDPGEEKVSGRRKGVRINFLGYPFNRLQAERHGKFILTPFLLPDTFSSPGSLGSWV